MTDWTTFGLRDLPPMSARTRVVDVPPFVQAILDERTAELERPLVGVTTDGVVRAGLTPSGGAPVPTEALADAAQAFLAALPVEQRERATFAVDAVEWLSDPRIAGVLLFVGWFALMFELSTPGVGLPGFIAVICFMLYFWSQFLHGTAGSTASGRFPAGRGAVMLGPQAVGRTPAGAEARARDGRSSGPSKRQLLWVSLRVW